MPLVRHSPCKVNLLLNILGRRPDGFHELETIFHPVPFCDRMEFERVDAGITVGCDDPAVPSNPKNLAHRAATVFLNEARIKSGVGIRIEKRIPAAAGLGGGSSNAATTLLALNELFQGPLSDARLHKLAAKLGSDVAFFLQDRPALAAGRGEKIVPLEFFPALEGIWIVLVFPGFGISTPWAYQQLARFPEALKGERGRAQRLADLLRGGDLAAAAGEFYNALEAPALYKYPILESIQEFFRANGAAASLMSGSGAATFALVDGGSKAGGLLESFKEKFGPAFWTASAPLGK